MLRVSRINFMFWFMLGGSSSWNFMEIWIILLGRREGVFRFRGLFSFRDLGLEGCEVVRWEFGDFLVFSFRRVFRNIFFFLWGVWG